MAPGVKSSNEPPNQGLGKDTERAVQQAPVGSTFEAISSYVYVIMWITLSATVILFNKYVLAYSGFPYPITLTTWHMIFCSAVSSMLVQGGYVKPVEGMTAAKYRTAIAPIGVAFALVLWLGNAAYLYLSVSFIQMIKALMPMAVFVVGTFYGTETFTWSTLGNMTVITLGVGIAAYGEVNFILVGFLLQLGSIGLEACRLTMIQILLQQKSGLKLNSVTTMYYVSPCCAVALILPWMALEAPRLYAAIVNDTLVIQPMLLLGNAMAAFALNLAVYLLIGKTSALTMNLAGVFKDWLLIGLSSLLYSSEVTAINIGGYLIAFFAVLFHNQSKRREAAHKAAMLVNDSAAAKGEETVPLVGGADRR